MDDWLDVVVTTVLGAGMVLLGVRSYRHPDKAVGGGGVDGSFAPFWVQRIAAHIQLLLGALALSVAARILLT